MAKLTPAAKPRLPSRIFLCRKTTGKHHDHHLSTYRATYQVSDSRRYELWVPHLVSFHGEKHQSSPSCSQPPCQESAKKWLENGVQPFNHFGILRLMQHVQRGFQGRCVRANAPGSRRLDPSHSWACVCCIVRHCGQTIIQDCCVTGTAGCDNKHDSEQQKLGTRWKPKQPQDERRSNAKQQETIWTINNQKETIESTHPAAPCFLAARLALLGKRPVDAIFAMVTKMTSLIFSKAVSTRFDISRSTAKLTSTKSRCDRSSLLGSTAATQRSNFFFLQWRLFGRFVEALYPLALTGRESLFVY